MRLVIVGPPGSGKGTQTSRLAQRFGLPKVSTGDLLRQEMAARTPLGEQIRARMDAGELVSLDEWAAVMTRALVEPGQARGALFDGAVRTREQAERLDGILAALGTPVDAVLAFAADESALIERIAARVVCGSCQEPTSLRREIGGVATACTACGGHLVRRPEDAPEKQPRRFAIYREEAAPILAHYRATGRPILDVDALGAPDVVEQRVHDVLRGVGLLTQAPGGLRLAAALPTAPGLMTTRRPSAVPREVPAAFTPGAAPSTTPTPSGRRGR